MLRMRRRLDATGEGQPIGNERGRDKAAESFKREPREVPQTVGPGGRWGLRSVVLLCHGVLGCCCLKNTKFPSFSQATLRLFSTSAT